MFGELIGGSPHALGDVVLRAGHRALGLRRQRGCGPGLAGQAEHGGQREQPRRHRECGQPGVHDERQAGNCRGDQCTDAEQRGDTRGAHHADADTRPGALVLQLLDGQPHLAAGQFGGVRRDRGGQFPNDMSCGCGRDEVCMVRAPCLWLAYTYLLPTTPKATLGGPSPTDGA